MQFAPVDLKDRTGPVENFQPRDITNGVATYAQGSGVPIAEKRISVSSTRTTTGRVKLGYKIAIPIVQDVTVNGISRPTVVRTAYADLTVTCDSTSNEAERANMRYHLLGLLGSDLGFRVIDKLETLY